MCHCLKLLCFRCSPCCERCWIVCSTVSGQIWHHPCCVLWRHCCWITCLKIWYPIKIVLTKLIAFLFSHIGLCGLVAGYCVLGAFIFPMLERPYEMTRLGHIVQEMLRYTKSQPFIRPQEWKQKAEKLLRDYEFKMVYAVTQEGYVGNDDNQQPQWTFYGGLLYSIATLTTIGYGNVVPKTKLGRMVTVVYAMFGIPLVMLCLARIAETLAQVFTFIYFRICCAYCNWEKRRRMQKRAMLTYRSPGSNNLRKAYSTRSYPRIRDPGGSGGNIRRGGSFRSQGKKGSSADNRSVRSYGKYRDRYYDRWDTRSLPDRKPFRRAETSPAWDSRSLIPAHIPNSRPRTPQQIHSATVRLPKEKYSMSPRMEKAERFDRLDTMENSATGVRGFRNPEYMRAMDQNNKTGRLTCICIQGIESPSEVELQDLTSKNEAAPIKPSTSTQKLKDIKESSHKLPQIIINETTYNVEDQKVAEEETKFTEELEPKLDTRPLPIDTVVTMMADERSTITSKRSDEASLRSIRKTAATHKRQRMPVSVGFAILFLFIMGGATLFTFWEGWNFFDSAYFCFITIATIGFGDIVPSKSFASASEEKPIITSIYLLIGLALIGVCFTLMQDDVVRMTREVGEKIGLLVKEISSDEESDYEDEMIGIEDEDNDLSDHDKPTVSSG